MFINKAKRLAKKRKREEEAKAKQKKLEAKYQGYIDKSTTDMLSKPCPFKNDECCIDTCVHFKHGRIFTDYSFSVHTGGESWTTYSLPKCKLWK